MIQRLIVRRQLFGVEQRKCTLYLGRVLLTSGPCLRRYVTLYGSCDPGDDIMTSAGTNGRTFEHSFVK